MATTTLFEADLPGLERLHRGKVRELYALPGGDMLMVASDRLSAFDVILPDPIPGKGEILTSMSNFWFEHTRTLVANHLTGRSVASVLPTGVDARPYEKRSVVVRRLKPIPVECIARGYLIGSGWKDYQASGKVCGIALPAGLRQAERLPEPIFTPSTKAAVGNHDENIGFDEVVRHIGGDLAEQVRALTLAVYGHAARYAAERGILIADTKFEFGQDEAGRVVLMDEVLTPDSSRFWPADEYGVAAEFRQAIRARLSGNPRLEQAGPRPARSRRHHRGYPSALSRCAAPPDRHRALNKPPQDAHPCPAAQSLRASSGFPGRTAIRLRIYRTYVGIFAEAN